MKFSFEVKVNSTKQKIWECYANLDKWKVWEEDLENISLEGDFVTGTKGKMKLAGMPELDFTLSSVIEECEFIDTTSTPMGVITFGHFITEKNNQIFIKHEVSLDSDNEVHLEILGKIFSDVPQSMFLLKKAVE